VFAQQNQMSHIYGLVVIRVSPSIAIADVIVTWAVSAIAELLVYTIIHSIDSSLMFMLEATGGTFDREKHERSDCASDEQDPNVWFFCQCQWNSPTHMHTICSQENIGQGWSEWYGLWHGVALCHILQCDYRLLNCDCLLCWFVFTLAHEIYLVVLCQQIQGLSLMLGFGIMLFHVTRKIFTIQNAVGVTQYWWPLYMLWLTCVWVWCRLLC